LTTDSVIFLKNNNVYLQPDITIILYFSSDFSVSTFTKYDLNYEAFQLTMQFNPISK